MYFNKTYGELTLEITNNSGNFVEDRQVIITNEKTYLKKSCENTTEAINIIYMQQIVNHICMVLRIKHPQMKFDRDILYNKNIIYVITKYVQIKFSFIMNSIYTYDYTGFDIRVDNKPKVLYGYNIDACTNSPQEIHNTYMKLTKLITPLISA